MEAERITLFAETFLVTPETIFQESITFSSAVAGHEAELFAVLRGIYHEI